MHESLTTIEEPEVELEGQASRPVLEGHLADEGVLHVGVQREADDGNFFLFDEGLDHGEVGLGLKQRNLLVHLEILDLRQAKKTQTWSIKNCHF